LAQVEALWPVAIATANWYRWSGFGCSSGIVVSPFSIRRDFAGQKLAQFCSELPKIADADGPSYYRKSFLIRDFRRMSCGNPV
jgi:hypothetical protein